MTKKIQKITFYLLIFILFSGSMMLVSAESPTSQEQGLIYSTFVGTSSWDGAEAITVDNQGRAYVVAQTEATGGFPALNGSQAAHEVNTAVFRLNAAGTAIEYVLYFNPDPNTTELEDYGYDIAVDSTGSAYVVGQADREGQHSIRINLQ